MRPTILWMRSSFSLETAKPLTNRSGPWSQRPVHEVISTVTRPSGPGFAGFDTQLFTQALEQGQVAQHAVGDVIAETNVVADGIKNNVVWVE